MRLPNASNSLRFEQNDLIKGFMLAQGDKLIPDKIEQCDKCDNKP